MVSKASLVYPTAFGVGVVEWSVWCCWSDMVVMVWLV